MLTIAVVDDEREHIEKFKKLVARFFTDFPKYGSEYNIIEFSSGEQLLENYAPRYDVIFLDIDMGGISGMEAAKIIRKTDENTAIVFVTRMARYAIEGYSVDAIDFIVKPLDYASFSVKMKRALSRIEKSKSQQITLSIDGEIHIIDVRDILYVEVLNHYVIWHTKNGDYRIWGSLKDATDQIEDSNFCMCNRCYLVNLRHVKGLDKNTVRVGEEDLVISRYRRKEFVETLAQYYGRGGV
ncbi:MAG: response regulator transcription factor [Clostridiales bacterium]|nr:response regulator transcription factor [Clostridiales bacterium]